MSQSAVPYIGRKISGALRGGHVAVQPLLHPLCVRTPLQQKNRAHRRDPLFVSPDMNFIIPNLEAGAVSSWRGHTLLSPNGLCMASRREVPSHFQDGEPTGVSEN